MTDLEKYNNQGKYPYEVKEKTEEFLKLLEQLDIELIILDSPIVNENNTVKTDRGVSYEDLIKQLNIKIKRYGCAKLYFYNLQYKFDKFMTSSGYEYTDTYYVRWLYK